ncbi:LCP family protein [Neobacillus sp. PS3-40]|uniref:LCP family protein n=1 Tax=Neobacillus sp. PS3-40 TaxID=3070679 RepID=UPI0027E11421|nr:LCP family protein [Neobacillus sp. PS3-40]WML46100.1 LCP family protein [Neobacillus sp. PS3-40]
MAVSRSMRKKKKRIRWGRWITTFLVIIIIGFISYFSYDVINSAKNASSKIYQKLDTSKMKKYRDQEVTITKDPFTILLAGIENQDGGKGRSDVLLLITVNPETKQVYELSIPRDTRTYIPAADERSKINSAYSHGGIEATIGAVNELFDVPIDYYITTNFEGFEDIVNTLGGVKVDVPFTFKAQLTKSLKWKTFHQGSMDLNGNQALAYVRMRKSDPHGDFGRNERQKQVIKTIIDKGTSFSSITKIDNILGDLGDNVKTNIPPSKLASFIKLYSKLKSTQINNLKLEGKDEYINNIYYFGPDQSSLDENNQTLRAALKLDSSTAGSNN